MLPSLPYLQFLRAGRWAEHILTQSGINLAGAEGFEPPSSVLETDSLAVELTPLTFAADAFARAPPLLRFFVRGVFATLTAELLEFQPAGRGLLVLGGGVVAVFALSTLQRNNFTGHLNLPFRFTSQVGLRSLVRVEARISAKRLAPPKKLNSGCPVLPPSFGGRAGYESYAIISLMVPAPTVRPPSRIANRKPFSIATGVINSISSATLSPGITISVPAGNVATPVTSVVRK